MSKVETKSTPERRPMKPETVQLSEKLQQTYVKDETAGIISDPENTSTYLQNLPEGLTPEIVDQKDNYDSTYIAASLHAAGVIATDMMKSNKKLETVTGEFQMGSNAVSHAITRRSEYRAPGSASDAEPIVKFGTATTKVEVRGAHNAGELRKARLDIGEMATEKLGRKK